MANKSNFKGMERQVAKDFHTTRAPVCNNQTHSDTFQETLYIECKKRKNMYIWNLFKDTKKKAKAENKIPMCAIKETGKKGYLVVCRPEDLWPIACEHIIGGLIIEQNMRREEL